MPTPASPRSFLFLALAFAASSCAAGPSGPAISDHDHRFTTTVTVTDTAVLPSAEVRIPAFSTVVWRNTSAAPLRIEISAAACPSCETVLGFAASEGVAVAGPLAPGTVATICFHDAGTFPFVVHTASGERRGTIVVGADR